MAIYRGPGGSGDATTDATNQASVASDAAAAALVSETNAATSAANAATSATAAASSASGASTSATNAASSASSAASSASTATTQATNAATSASNAATSAADAATTYDNFDDRYLGSKASAPSVDNDGNALLTGALYWNSTSNTMNVWTGSAWTGLGGSSGVSSFNTRTGAVTLSSSDVTTALTYTPLNPANNLSEVTASTARTNLSVPSTTGSGATGTWNIDILGNAGTVTNGVVTSGSYANPSWITSLAETKVLPSQTGNSGKYLTTNGTSTSWATVSGGGASALDDLTDVVLTSPSTGQVLKYNGTNWINDTDSVGSGSFAYPSAGIAVSTGSAWATSLTDNSANWNTAYTDRLKWDGGSTGLTASTGRTSLGATTVGSNLFTLADPSAITFPRFNADNTVSSLSASDFRTAIGAGTSSTTGTVTSITAGTGLSGGTITSSGTIAIDGTVATLTGAQTLTNKTISGASNTLSNIGNSSLTNSAITINGTSTSLGGSISVGTVTSVALSAPSIFTVTGSPVTSSGTLTLAYSGTALPVLNGGTGVTTSTGSGGNVLSIRPTMSVTGSGLTLQDATDNTKQANFDLSGLTTATTRSYTLPNVTGTLATLGNIAQTFTGATTFSSSLIASNTLSLTGSATDNQSVATSQTAGALFIGGTSGTGTITLGRSTVSQTTNIQAGATASGSTKTINIGTGGLSGSTTTMAIGSTFGTSVTANGSWTFSTAVGVASGGTGATTLTGLVVGNGTSPMTTVTAPSGAVVGTTDTQTLSGKTLTDPLIIGTITEDVFTITDAAGFAIDPTNGSIQLITLGANRTPTQANWAAGESITLMINDGTAFTVTWTTLGVVWVGGTAPTLALTGYTVIELWKVSTTIYGALVGTVA